jgi:HrpA-like RNA helicase
VLICLLFLQILLDAGYGEHGVIGVTQPRRVVSPSKQQQQQQQQQLQQ